MWADARDSLLDADPTSPRMLEAVEQPGLYSWWDLAGALTPFWPTGFPAVDISKPLYVGIAQTSLRTRGADMHLTSTRVSTVRRNLVALLHDELDLLPGAKSDPRRRTKFGLAPDREERLTEWMEANLSVTWVVTPDAGLIESAVIEDLLSPLNDIYAHSGPYWKPMGSARDLVIRMVRS